MSLRTKFAVFAGQLVLKLSRSLKLGAGATWPGEVALAINPKLISKLVSPESKIVIVAGTNGKTTTAKMTVSILGKSVIHNETGANLLNGVASILIKNYPHLKVDYLVFEVDEGVLPLLLKQIKPTVLVLMNLFRDQLDRYGEVDTIAKKWLKVLKEMTDVKLVVNGDDPHLAWIAKSVRLPVYAFGIGNKDFYLEKMQHAADSTFCPNCGNKLTYSGVYFSHLGDYRCVKCGFDHPKNNMAYKANRKYMLEGIYNIYNYLAAESVAQILKIKADFSDFKPAFGRGEEIGDVKILLSKNPAGFNESLRTVINSGRKGPLLLALNDRIPDGRDVSWIWDVDFEILKDYSSPIFVSGDRALDLGLRLKYAEISYKIKHELNVSWILATYSAMLDIRKELTGRKIL